MSVGVSCDVSGCQLRLVGRSVGVICDELGGHLCGQMRLVGRAIGEWTC